MLMFSPTELPFAYIKHETGATPASSDSEAFYWDQTRISLRSGEDEAADAQPVLWATTQQQMQNRIKWEEDLGDDMHVRDPDMIDDFFFGCAGTPSCYQSSAESDEYFWRPPPMQPTRPTGPKPGIPAPYDTAEDGCSFYDTNRFVMGASPNPPPRPYPPQPTQQLQPQQSSQPAQPALQQNPTQKPSARYPQHALQQPQQQQPQQPQQQQSQPPTARHPPSQRMAAAGCGIPQHQAPLQQQQRISCTPSGDIVSSSYPSPSAVNNKGGNPRIFHHTFHPAGIPLASTTTTTTATTTTVVAIPATMAVTPQQQRQLQTQPIAAPMNQSAPASKSSAHVQDEDDDEEEDKDKTGSPTMRTKGSICKSSSGGSSASGKKRRNRATPAQLEILERAFERGMIPNLETRQYLAGQLGFTERRVQVWFQNRRAKLKKANRRSQVFVLNHGGGDMGRASS